MGGTAANNKWYVVIDGVNVSSYVMDLALDPSNSLQETTMGADQNDVQREPGLNDFSLSLTIGWSVSNISTYIGKLQPGSKVVIEVGLQGNVSGKPRHQQEFIIDKNNIKKSVSKAPIAFSLSAQGSDTPVYNMFEDVYP